MRRTTVHLTTQTATHQCILFITACITHDHDEEKRIQQNLLIRSGKSEEQVTCQRRLRLTIEATRRHEASRGLSATGGLLVVIDELTDRRVDRL